MQVKSISFETVEQFSFKDKEYTVNSEKYKEFISTPFAYESFPGIIDQRKQFPVDRSLLKRVVQKQYEGLSSSQATEAYIDMLDQDNCYTVTTAHQPSLFSGPLYYPFKILSTVRLTERLRADHSDCNIVPVFIIGGEDHDFEEINHLHLYGKRLEWNSEGAGAVGRYAVDGIVEVFNQIKDILGERTRIEGLLDKISDIISTSKNYGELAFRFSHLLFDKFGVVILRMDNEELKQAFSEKIKKEILESPSQSLIEQTQDKLEALGFSKQAHAREINFFYHCDEGRKRIVNEEGIYKVLDTDISFTKEELVKEINNNAVNFSPNVVMRPIYQESILPNLAYIGGGGEIAYWMERKAQFEHFETSFPMLVRRNSAMFMTQRQLDQMSELSLTLEDLFKDKHELVKYYLEKSDQPDVSLDDYKNQLNKLFEKLDTHISAIDQTLSKTTKAEASKAEKSILYLESKLRKTIKQREEVQLNRIQRTKDKLFPSGLQERHDNILEYLSAQGEDLLEKIYSHMDPFDKDLKVFVLE